MATPRLTIAESPRKKLAVVSHERSGTHFLMNTVANHFGYVSQPWWNVQLGFDFYFPKSILGYWLQLHDKPVLNILKSHHPATFFPGILGYFTQQFHVLYIYRDPRDTLVSYWKEISRVEGDPGPRTDSAGEFIRAAPSGAVLRYQKRQERNMLQRWRTHVESWLDASSSHPDYPLLLVRYEDLYKNFAETVDRIGDFTGLPRGPLHRPKPTENVVGGGKGGIGGYRDYLNAAEVAFVADEVGDFMKGLGYSP